MSYRDRLAARWHLARAYSHNWWARAKYGIRLRSVQLAIASGGLGAYFMTYPDQYQGLLAKVPEEFRPYVGLFVFGALPFIARMAKQSKLPPPPPGVPH